MNYERFSELWDALVSNRPKSPDAAPIMNGMSAATAAALIDYAKGDKSKITVIKANLLHLPKL